MIEGSNSAQLPSKKRQNAGSCQPCEAAALPCAAAHAWHPATVTFAPLTTARLVLRRLTAADATAVAAYRADPAIARYQAWHASDAEAARLAPWFEQHEATAAGDAEGVGLLLAIRLRDGGGLIGDCTLRVRSDEPGTAELGYSLAPAHHGRGYATEAARAALRVGFEGLGLPEIVSFTSLINRPSRAVMERIGMRDSGEDFDHPALPEGSDLRRHCLYRITREQWSSVP